MCPGEEFLPHPPDPDDLVFEDSTDNHHGNDSNDNHHGNEKSMSEGGAQDPQTPPTNTEAPPTNDATTSQDHISETEN